MGVFSNGSIYGFSILADNIVYKDVSEHPVRLNNIMNFRNAYNMLSEDELKKAIFYFYCEASSSYCHGVEGPFVAPFPVSKENVLAYLNKSDGISCSH